MTSATSAGCELDGDAGDLDPSRSGGRPDLVPQQPGERGGHAAAAEQRRPLVAVLAVPAAARDQPVDRALVDALLAERGQHLGDVGDEHAVRPHDEHALARELGVGVEQPRGAVQADRGLAGAGAALHDERAVGRQADQLVLLRRDRRDDLAHLADALARDVVDDRLGEVLLPGLELLVDEPEHGAILDVEPAPAADAARVGRRGGVERLGGRRPPVDRQQAVALVGDRVPPDVERPVSRPVDPPEVQRPARAGVRAEALEPHPLEHLLREHVALAVPPADGERVEQRVIGGEGPVEVLLLLGELRIGGHHRHVAVYRRTARTSRYGSATAAAASVAGIATRRRISAAGATRKRTIPGTASSISGSSMAANPPGARGSPRASRGRSWLGVRGVGSRLHGGVSVVWGMPVTVSTVYGRQM